MTNEDGQEKLNVTLNGLNVDDLLGEEVYGGVKLEIVINLNAWDYDGHNPLGFNG